MHFSFLTQLDLFGNPLAEEPDYRLKIIHTMPQIEVLDRHRVTLQERQKAAKMAEQSTQKYRPKKKAMAGVEAHKYKGFSNGEKDLYKEVSSLKAGAVRQREAEELKT